MRIDRSLQGRYQALQDRCVALSRAYEDELAEPARTTYPRDHATVKQIERWMDDQGQRASAVAELMRRPVYPVDVSMLLHLVATWLLPVVVYGLRRYMKGHGSDPPPSAD
jgi:hypothetical protein